MSRDIDTLARTLWGEARGEGVAGMEAVASVIMNRRRLAERYVEDRRQERWREKPLRHPLFGDGTVATVCTAPWQFSCWNPDDPNRNKLSRVSESDDQWFAAALDVARRAVAGKIEDRTGGADHYHTKAIKPKWAEGRTPTATIGWHVFYKLG